MTRRLLYQTVLVLFSCLCAFSAQVVYLDGPGSQSRSHEKFEAAADFYGLTVEYRPVTGHHLPSSTLKLIADPQTVALVASSAILPWLDKETIVTTIRRRLHPLPILIDGISEDTETPALTKWSGGIINQVRQSSALTDKEFYHVSESNPIARELAGTNLPAHVNNFRYFILSASGASRPLLVALPTGQHLPVFVVTLVGGQQIFLLARSSPKELVITADPYLMPSVFANLAPYMMFLRYAGGDALWHPPASFANLTIDDIWLEPQYGFVNYKALLSQMQVHHFHTTLAFVPWNFDRSVPEAVSLLKSHPDQFSVCIHGNNHDHQEFGPYATHPLEKQAKDVAQAIARMERFRQLTSINYDPVMVFPHSIAPQATLALLKQYNFLATANSRNVPSDAPSPANNEFALRTATLEFANFASLRRYSDEVSRPDSQLAIEAFLNNPILFYVHQGFFGSGDSAFNRTADAVNRLLPGVQWRSLGDIAEHLYLQRTRNDGNKDIRSFSPRVRIENHSQQAATYFIEKAENFAEPFELLVDGNPYPYEESAKGIRLQITIAADSSRVVALHYQNQPLSAVGIAKDSTRVRAIRYLSDLRDDVVSRTGAGRWFIRSYSEHTGFWKIGAAALVGLLIFLLAISFARHLKKNSLDAAAALSSSAGSSV